MAGMASTAGIREGKQLTPPPEFKVICARIPKKVWRQVRERALKSEITVQQFLTDALEQHLKPAA